MCKFPAQADLSESGDYFGGRRFYGQQRGSGGKDGHGGRADPGIPQGKRGNLLGKKPWAFQGPGAVHRVCGQRRLCGARDV